MQVTSAFAEYLEVTERGNLLNLTLSNYDIGCNEFVPPTGDQVYLSVLVAMPLGITPTPGIYPFREAVSPLKAVDKAQSVPTVRVPGKNHLFKPGGGIQLTKVELSDHGSVSGLLAFQFAGDGTHSATSVTGPFDAKICTLDRLEKPKD